MDDKKSKFLIDFISNKYLNEIERKKAIELAFKELSENSVDIKQEVIESLRQINIFEPGDNPSTKMIHHSFSEDDIHKSSRRGENLPDYKDPGMTSRFLLAYNQDPILKYTCHEIDEVSIVEEICIQCKTKKYDLEAHQKLISKSFNELQKKIDIPSNVWALISTYINGPGSWSSGIKVNWNCSELRAWGNDNPHRVPNPGENLINKYKYDPFKFKAFTSALTGQRIRNFSELTIFFKYLFHIRSDNSLKSMLENINQKKGWGDKAIFTFHEKDFVDNMEVFTHVDQILNAYKKLISLIIDYADKKNLEKPKIQFS